MPTESEVFRAIQRERDYQDGLWTAGRELPLSVWMEIIREEVDEAEEAWEAEDYEHCREELLQVAAAIVATLESRGIVEREEINAETRERFLRNAERVDGLSLNVAPGYQALGDS